MLDQTFGGSWTERKLAMIRGYLPAYMKILEKRSSLKTAYIDAFAGTGYRQLKDRCAEIPSLFDEFAEQETRDYLDGSARIALQTEPSFYRYIFIEMDPKKCAELEALKTEFPDKADRINVENMDANECIARLCSPSMDWKSHRAMLFLDPFGMQVSWETVKLIAATKAIDLWYLFPIGSVNRLLSRGGCTEPYFADCLDRVLGDESWRTRFYKPSPQQSLFGEDERVEKDAGFEAIGEYIIERLASIFAGVCRKPYILRNSRNSPLFMLCFAVGNPGAVGPAISIASWLMKD